MSELPWASPAAVGKLTLPQLLCVANEKPPAADGGPETFEDYEAIRRARLDADKDWDA